jgi:hypothetical protein
MNKSFSEAENYMSKVKLSMSSCKPAEKYHDYNEK